MIFRLKRKLSDEERAKIKEALKDDAKEETVARIKEEDIKIKDISLESNLIRNDSGIVAFVIAGVRVNFEYSKLKADIFVETDRVLTIKEIKQKIINNDFRKPKGVKEDM